MIGERCMSYKVDVGLALRQDNYNFCRMTDAHFSRSALK